jgi:hypothetical protein
MFEQEKERGQRLGTLSRTDREDLVAQLMFGRRWQQARAGLIMLLQTWGVRLPELHEPDGTPDHA